MSELIQKVDPQNSESAKSLPETKKQAYAAAENRRSLTEHARESAELVVGKIRSTGESMKLDMGQDKNGNQRFATLALTDPSNPHNKQLRVKVLDPDGKPQTSFVYTGLYDYNHRPDGHVMKEVPTAEGANVQNIPGEPMESVRSVALQSGVDGDVYRGGDIVTDMGGMDFLATTQIMSAAAEQIRVEDAMQNQQAT